MAPSGFPADWVTRDLAFSRICSGTSVSATAVRMGLSRGALCQWVAREMPDVDLLNGPRGLDPVPDDFGGPSRLCLPERQVIALGLQQGQSVRAIAGRLNRAASTVSREIRRYASERTGVYHAAIAHRRAWAAARRPKIPKLAAAPGLCRAIEAWMDDGWSPRLISQVLAAGRQAGEHEGMTISHETIYRALYVQTRGGLRADLARQLSTGRTRRKPRSGAPTTRYPAHVPEAYRIAARPAEAADRAVPGHWEGDLIIGKAASGAAIGTLVERTTRYVLLLHLPTHHGAATVAEAMIAAMAHLPDQLRRSLAWDRGQEMAHHEKIRMELSLPVYFCDPHSPWQRGSNENTNRLLRHWFPKNTAIDHVTAEDLKRVQDKLNARPRPTLGLRTPAQALAELLDQEPVATTA
jgi:IS30 family transposase